MFHERLRLRRREGYNFWSGISTWFFSIEGAVGSTFGIVDVAGGILSFEDETPISGLAKSTSCN